MGKSIIRKETVKSSESVFQFAKGVTGERRETEKLKVQGKWAILPAGYRLGKKKKKNWNGGQKKNTWGEKGKEKTNRIGRKKKGQGESEQTGQRKVPKWLRNKKEEEGEYSHYLPAILATPTFNKSQGGSCWKKGATEAGDRGVRRPGLTERAWKP